jgi:hypothetical protein
MTRAEAYDEAARRNASLQRGETPWEPGRLAGDWALIHGPRGTAATLAGGRGPVHPETRATDEGVGLTPALDVHWQRGF